MAKLLRCPISAVLSRHPYQNLDQDEIVACDRTLGHDGAHRAVHTRILQWPDASVDESVSVQEEIFPAPLAHLPALTSWN